MNKLIDKLIKKDIKKDIFFKDLENITGLDGNISFEILKANGLPIEIIDDIITLKTKRNKIKNEIFTIVDIETNGIKLNNQIIEIGAVKIKDNKIIDTFHTLVYASEINQAVVKLTGISVDMLVNKPFIKDVLIDFRLFLGTTTFVAHNVKFDYDFISKSLDKYNLGILLNRKLCTIDLAQRSFEAQKYGLKALKELLSIENNHHRAFDDAKATFEVFKYSLDKIKDKVNTTEDLIAFSKG